MVSNGLLVSKTDKRVFEEMKKCNAELYISNYPPTVKLMDDITDICASLGVKVSFSEPVIDFFATSDGSDIFDIKESYDACESKTCHFLYDGTVSLCGFPIIYKKLGNKIESNIVVNDDDIIDLYDEKLTSAILMKRMNSPITMCKYCDKKNKKWFNWQGGYTKYFSSQMLKNNF